MINMDIKGLILSGGKGTRLRPLTHTRAKQLIPIGGKPNLYYVVDDLVAVGITDIGIIISPDTGDEVKNSLGDGSRWNAKFTFIVQESAAGLADAVRAGRSFLGDSPFVMYLGDNLLSGGIGHMVKDFAEKDLASVLLLTEVENPTAFGVAVLDANGKVVQLIEKPNNPPSNLALVGVYLFTPKIHDIIATLKPSARGEYEITEAIQGLVDLGLPVEAHLVRGWWKDTGKPEDLLDANRLTLSNISRKIEGDVMDSEIIGEVIVEPGAVVRGSTVRGPAFIGKGATVTGSFIGPYSAVGERAKVINSEVEYSILMAESEVVDLPYRLDSSILGEKAEVVGGAKLRTKSMQLILSDRSLVKV